MNQPLVVFTVPGRPLGQPRPRAVRTGKGVRMYTKKWAVAYADLIREAWRQAAPADWKPWPGVAFLYVNAEFAAPKSWPKWRRETEWFYPSKPDTSNIVKMVEDALNGLAWVDDAQVQIGKATKSVADADSLDVIIKFEQDARMIHERAKQMQEVTG